MGWKKRYRLLKAKEGTLTKVNLVTSLRTSSIGNKNKFSPWQCFFLTRENEKCPRKRFLVLFLVFFSGRIFLLAHFFEIFSRAVLSFSGTFFVFFLGLIFFFGQKFKNFLGQTFFFSGRIFSAGFKYFNGFHGWFFAKLERVVNFCYRRNFANVPLVSATGKMDILIFIKRNSKV